ncbi:MAG TPA: hypothetical protein VMY87_11120 [Armatimonadota bacterium]|nr:hypothetical protein [Armatimonadota bacterium]
MSGILRLLHSSKFWTAIGAVAGVVLTEALGMDEKSAGAIVTALITLAGIYILGTAGEDIAAKLKGATPTAPVRTVAPEDETVDE